MQHPGHGASGSRSAARVRVPRPLRLMWRRAGRALTRNQAALRSWKLLAVNLGHCLILFGTIGLWLPELTLGQFPTDLRC